jgi:hypothetical protein
LKSRNATAYIRIGVITQPTEVEQVDQGDEAEDESVD